DEGHTAIVHQTPDENEENTALMVNPWAAASVLVDAAQARAGRVEAITRIFHFMNEDAVSQLPEDVVSDVLTSLNGMSHDVLRLLEAAQHALARQTGGISHE